MAFAPQTFTKGGKTMIALTPGMAVDLAYNGWALQGAAPARPRTELNASLADLDGLSSTYDAAVGGRKKSKVRTDGADQTAALQAELDALRAAGGGSLLLPSGTVTINGTLTLGNDGATPAKQPVLHLIGQGAHWSGRGTAPVGGTTLDIKGTDTYGKLKTNGLGLLALTGVTFKDSAGTTTPFLYTVNTTLHIDQCSFVGSKTGDACDQDAIVCGGTLAVEGGNGWNDGFQGYGTVITRNFFHGIRRAVYGRTFFNANVITENTVWSTCGHAGGAAFELDGDSAGTAGGSACVGNVIADNLIELPNYKWGIRLVHGASNTVRHNNGFDALPANNTCMVRVESVGQSNVVYEGFTVGDADGLDDQSGSTLFYSATQGVYSHLGPAIFADINYPTTIARLVVDSEAKIKPATAQPAGARLLEFDRSGAEAADPGAPIYWMQYDGTVVFGDAANAAGNVTGPYSNFSGGGRSWSAVGTKAGQENGSNMTIDSGPGGSYLNLRNYGVRVYDHTGTQQATIGAGGGRVTLFNGGEPPTPTGGGTFYVEGGALKFKGSAGTVTTIAPA